MTRVSAVGASPLVPAPPSLRSRHRCPSLTRSGRFRSRTFFHRRAARDVRHGYFAPADLRSDRYGLGWEWRSEMSSACCVRQDWVRWDNLSVSTLNSETLHRHSLGLHDRLEQPADVFPEDGI